LQLDMKAIVYT